MKKYLIYLLLFISINASGQRIIGIITSSGIGTISATELVTNGDFASSASWTLTNSTAVSGGECVINSASTYVPMVRQTIVIEVGKTYNISFDITNYTSGTIRVMLGHPDTGVDGNNVDYNANQHVSFNQIFTSATTELLITFYSWSTGSVMHIDNVSVKEVL